MSIFSNQQTQNAGLFGTQNQQAQNTGLFGTQNQQTQNTGLFGANNTINNKPGNASFGANNNPTNNFSFGAGGNNLFNNNSSITNTTNFLGGNNAANQKNNIFSNLNNPGQNTNNIFSQNNQQNTNNNMQQQKPNNNILGNLSGINANNNNQKNIFQQNNLLNNPNQSRNQLLNLNNPKVKYDLEEYKQVLQNISNCCDPSQVENMFKDYLYMPIPKGTSPNDANVYRPYTIAEGQQKIINDFHIWEQGTENNTDPNKFFPIQISSVDALLERYKYLEKGILQSIAKTVETQKSLENLNKKIDDEMNNKILELKNCHIKLDKLQLGLSSKVAQYNYLLGTSKENVNDTKQIKENIKKANDNIKKNNMIEISEKVKKFSNEEIGGESKDYIKEINKDKINYMMDALVEIQNMMNVINTNNKKNLNIVNGMQKEVDRIMKKNEI